QRRNPEVSHAAPRSGLRRRVLRGRTEVPVRVLTPCCVASEVTVVDQEVLVGRASASVVPGGVYCLPLPVYLDLVPCMSIERAVDVASDVDSVQPCLVSHDEEHLGVARTHGLAVEHGP